MDLFVLATQDLPPAARRFLGRCLQEHVDAFLLELANGDWDDVLGEDTLTPGP